MGGLQRSEKFLDMSKTNVCGKMASLEVRPSSWTVFWTVHELISILGNVCNRKKAWDVRSNDPSPLLKYPLRSLKIL